MDLFGKNLVGLDIGSNSIKMVCLKDNGKKGYTLVSYAVRPVSAEAVEELDPDLKESVLTDALKKLFKEKKLTGRRVATAVSDAVIIRPVKLPFMTEQELKNVIRTEAEQHIPLPMDQVILDFQILGEILEDNQKKLEVVLVAAKEEMVDQHLHLLAAAGLKPAVIDTDAFAMVNSYEANVGREMGETVALINLGAKTTIVNVIEDGISHFTRDFAVAGNHLTKEIQREFNLDFSQAEELKKQQGAVIIESDEISLSRIPDKDDRSVRISEAITPVLNKMLSEIRRSFDFYENSIKKKAINKVVMSGGTAKLKNLDKFLSDKLGINVLLSDPFAKIHVDLKDADLELLKEQAPMLAVGLGLALRKPS